MIVRIVSYAAESLEGAKEWARSRADEARQAPGVEHAYLFSREEPPEAGAVILYASEQALREFMESDEHAQIIEEITETWAESGEPVLEEVYELADV